MQNSPNPLLAELSAIRARSGLFAARLNLDFALNNPTRVFWRIGYLSEGEAMRAGRRLAVTIGRDVIAAAPGAGAGRPGGSPGAGPGAEAPGAGRPAGAGGAADLEPGEGAAGRDLEPSR